VRSQLGRHRLALLETVAVEAADDAGLADRDVQARELGVVHDDVGNAGQRQAREEFAALTVEDGEHAAVGCAEEAAAVEPKPVRASCRHRERPLDLGPRAVDDEYLGGLADVRVDAVALLVEDGPARPPRKRQLAEHAHRLEVDDGGGAVLPERLAEVERVEAAPTAVVGESVRVQPDLDPAEQLLVRAAEDAHARGAAVAREEEVVLLVDQHAGHAGQIGERAQEHLRAAVDDVDAVGAGVRDVQAAAGAIDIGVVETGRRAGRYRHEADVAQAHAGARPCATSSLHQA
jgi:hypothetical protein